MLNKINKIKKIVILFICFFYSFISVPLIQINPICVIYTPDSILNNKKNYVPYSVGNRLRYATCTGVAWFHNKYIAVLNLYGHNIVVYKFIEDQNRLELLQKIDNKNGLQLSEPENLVISPRGDLLAVCNGSSPGINIYKINLNTHLTDPKPILTLKASSLIHNAKFSSDGQHLAFCTFDDKNALQIYKILNYNNNLSLKFSSKIENRSRLGKIKALHFTKNNDFILTVNANALDGNKIRGVQLSVYKFDSINGILDKLVFMLEILRESTIEDIVLIKNDTKIILSDQNSDSLLVYNFNPNTGYIDNNYNIINSPEARLSFPHGISVSQNEQYLAVANYGDDKFNIYKIL